MQSDMSNRAVIISCCILVSGVVMLRQYQWHRWITTVRLPTPVSLDIVLGKPVTQTISQCIIDYRGLEIRFNRDVCLQTGMEGAQAGDQVYLIGSWKQEVIRDKKSQKSFIQAHKLTLKNNLPQALVSLHWWQRYLTAVHRRIVAIYQMSLPEPEASLLAGIVVGEQRTLPSQFQQALVKTGLMHVVAASGYNVVVVVSTIATVAIRWCGRRWGSVLALGGIFLYVLLAGASPPVVRAGIMGGLSLLAVLSGRLYWAWWALFSAVMGMITISPWLIQSISFQLTVAATVGLMTLRPALECLWRPANTRLSSIHLIDAVRDSFLTTLAAVIATLPLQILYFNNASLLALIVNPMVSWIIPPLMSLGSIHAIMGLIWFPFTAGIAWVSYSLAHTFVAIVVWTSQTQFGYYSLTANWCSVVGWWLFWLGSAHWLVSHQRAQQPSQL